MCFLASLPAIHDLVLRLHNERLPAASALAGLVDDWLAHRSSHPYRPAVPILISCSKVEKLSVSDSIFIESPFEFRLSDALFNSCSLSTNNMEQLAECGFFKILDGHTVSVPSIDNSSGKSVRKSPELQQLHLTLD
ncbi:hypothetical protein ACMG4J_22635 [Rossellomorea marisflavi]|uniref:hypothetical protein n=1 Tax=Rossellomorea marisflavi TaxID=189381 RepID=UPI0039BF9456